MRRTGVSAISNGVCTRQFTVLDPNKVMKAVEVGTLMLVIKIYILGGTSRGCFFVLCGYCFASCQSFV